MEAASTRSGTRSIAEDCAAAKSAARVLASSTAQVKNLALASIANGLLERMDSILEANAEDLADYRARGLSEALTDRLRLDRARVEAMAEGGDRNINLFLNFNLTRKRLSLLAEVRRFKKEKKIEKYEVNENGQISIRIKSKWMKITHHYSKKTYIQPSELIYTYSNYKLQTTVEDLYSRS